MSTQARDITVARVAGEDSRQAGSYRAQVAVVGLLLCIAAALLALPQAAQGEGLPPLRGVVIDASASVVRLRPNWAGWVRSRLRAEAGLAGQAGAEVCVVVCASGASRALGPLDPAKLIELLDGRGTPRPFDPRLGGAAELSSDLGAGLTLLREQFRGRLGGTATLLSDGRATDDSAAAEADALARAGVTVGVQFPPRAELGDAGLIDLRLTREPSSGAPVAATALVRIRPGDRGATRWQLLAQWSGTEQGPDAAVLDLPHTAGEWPISLQLGNATMETIELELQLVTSAGLDPIESNDRLAARVYPRESRRLAIVAEASKLERARSSFSLPIPGLARTFLTPAELPLEMNRLDAVITWDLAPGKLSGELMRAAVERGMGWLAIGGWELFADWGFDPQAAFELLPMEPDPGDGKPRDVTLLVDGSGSMEGEPFDRVRTAALELARVAPPKDEVFLRFFTGRLREPMRIRSAQSAGASNSSRTQATARLLAAAVPGGSTRILESLETYAEERSKSKRAGLFFLLSDGIESQDSFDLERRCTQLRARLSTSDTDWKVIGIGDPVAREFFDVLLANETERLLLPAEMTDLGELFRREVSAERVREGDGLKLLQAPLVGLAAAIVETDPVDGTELNLPQVNRYLRALAKPDATVLWHSERGEPVLAASRVGTGRTAMLTTLPGSRWAPAWVDGGAALRSLLRWLVRSPAAQGAQLEPCESQLVARIGERAQGWIEMPLFDLERPSAAPQEFVFKRATRALGQGLIEYNADVKSVALPRKFGVRVPSGPLLLGAAADPLRLEFESPVRELERTADGLQQALPMDDNSRPHPAGWIVLAAGMLCLAWSARPADWSRRAWDW